MCYVARFAAAAAPQERETRCLAEQRSEVGGSSVYGKWARSVESLGNVRASETCAAAFTGTSPTFPRPPARHVFFTRTSISECVARFPAIG